MTLQGYDVESPCLLIRQCPGCHMWCVYHGHSFIVTILKMGKEIFNKITVRWHKLFQMNYTNSDSFLYIKFAQSCQKPLQCLPVNLDLQFLSEL